MAHAGSDGAIVEQLSRKLREASREPWLDTWYLVPGQPWQDYLPEALRQSATCAVCIGAQGLGDWQYEELRMAQNRAVKDRDFGLIPVLLPGLAEPFDPTSMLPPMLANRTWVDLRRGIDHEAGFARLLNAIDRLPTGPTGGPSVRELPPYRGLERFESEHAEYFFGRDADVQRLLEKLKESRFLAVLGPSGSGKSSLVRAGLVPALRAGELPASRDWAIGLFTPGARPLDSLALCLSQMGGHEDRLSSLTHYLDLLRRDTEALHLSTLLMSGSGGDKLRSVLIVDQFEEVFTLCDDEDERARFLANVVNAATVPGGRCVVILTLRADFYARCATYPSLAKQVAAHQYLVSRMERDSLRQVIEMPARQAGLALEEGLVDLLLDEVGDEPGLLPLLEHALLEVWQRREGSLLTMRAYQAAGRVSSALANRAEEEYARLSVEQQTAAREVLLRLTKVAPPDEGAEDTRRRASMSELAGADASRDLVSSTVSVLATARLLIIGHDELTGADTVEVAHEALIRSWPRFRGWIEDERGALVLRQRVSIAGAEWREHDRDASFLFVGSRLAEAQADFSVNSEKWSADEKAFLVASTALESALARGRLQRAIGAVGGVTLSVGAAFGLAFGVVLLWGGAAGPGHGPLEFVAGSLLVFTLNLPTGLGIALSLRLLAGRRLARTLWASGVGAVTSTIGLLLPVSIVIVAMPDIAGGGPGLEVVVGSACLGGGLGLGAAQSDSPRVRVITATAGGLLGAVLARALWHASIDPLVTLLAGVILGGVTGMGLLLTAFDNPRAPIASRNA
jgi:hypothetical protein